MEQLAGGRPTNLTGVEVAHMDSYLSEMRFDMHLEANGIYIEDAHELSRWYENGMKQRS